MNSPRHKYLLLITQVYTPDPAAVGQHMADVAEEMVRRGWRVLVLTASRGYEDPSLRYAARENRHGVEICRLPLSSFGKRSIAIRLLAQFLFLTQAVIRSLFSPGVSLVLVSTSPPLAGLAGCILTIVRRIPFVWWVMDINPDQLIASGAIGPHAVSARMFDWVNRLTLRLAKKIIVLDRFMLKRLQMKWNVPKKSWVVPPWSHHRRPASSPEEPTPFRVTHGLENAFIVMYSGNHAIQHPLATLLDSAERLQVCPRVRFVFIGGGAGKAYVQSRIDAGATNIVSLPYQPIEAIGDSLAAADVHIVTMGNDMVGIVHPCKIYGALAVGRPIVFLGPECSHVSEILAGSRFGRCVQHGDVVGTTAAIDEFFHMDKDERIAIGREAAKCTESRFSRAVSMGYVCDLLEGEVSRAAQHYDASQLTQTGCNDLE